MSNQHIPYHAYLMESLADRDEAEAYLSAALEDSPHAFRKALRNVIEARETVAAGTDGAGKIVDPYETTQQPSFDVLSATLQALGFHFSIQSAPTSIPEAA